MVGAVLVGRGVLRTPSQARVVDTNQTYVLAYQGLDELMAHLGMSMVVLRAVVGMFLDPGGAQQHEVSLVDPG